MKDTYANDRSAGRSHCHSMPFGSNLLPGGGACFDLWAPGAGTVELCLFPEEDRPVFSPMEKLPDGWFRTENREAMAGSLYQYRIDGSLLVPDPASRFQPRDIHGPSQIIEGNDFDWEDHNWPGLPWEEAVLYELHVGAFSPEGTFAGVEARLDYLAELGITAIQLMPVAAFPGKYNWGYDGVLLFAPANVYGHPDDLKRLVLKAHQKGIMVFLDVVYNHFGNEGNYLYVYAKEAFFRDDYHTPWGAAINFSGPGSRTVRDFYIHNALYWLEEYQLDGLRFDAVHGITDDSQPHILVEIAEAVAYGPGRDRHIHLILENDRNEAHFLVRKPDGTPKYYTAQWNDDIHHALHVLLTKETSGYYQDYGDDPVRHLGRCLAEGFAYQGEPSAYRHYRNRGESSRMLPLSAFVSFLQNHDQVGNRALGERMCTIVGETAIRLAASMLLLAPSPPLLFMGEEFSATTPFFYFCDFEGELARTVTEGRRMEFSRFPQFSDPELLEQIPVPCAAETFHRSCISWQERDSRRGNRAMDLYKHLINLRKQFVVPRLRKIVGEAATYHVISPKAIEVRWMLADGEQLIMMVNFGKNPVQGVFRPRGNIVYEYPEMTAGNGLQQIMAPQSILYLIDAPGGK